MNSNQSDDKLSVGWIFAALFLLCLFMATDKILTIRREAVEYGYAHWRVDSDGDTTWLWECVTVTRRVRLKISYFLNVNAPRSWSKEQIESHRNLSSFCCNTDLKALHEKYCLPPEDEMSNVTCCCDVAHAEFVSEIS